jgi:hypothetical protein
MDITVPFKEETLDKHICLCFCTRGNDIYWRMMLFTLEQSNIFKKLSVCAAISLYGPSAEAMFEEAVKSNADYALIIDTDVGPRPDTVVRMIEREKDIVTCPTYMYNAADGQIHFNVHYDGRKRVFVPREGGIEKVENTSWACVLVHRRVLEMFGQTNEKYTEWSPMLPESMKHRERYPPDSIFFEKARAFGFEIWVDWDLEIATHHKYVELSPNVCEGWIKRRIFAINDAEGTQRAAHLLARYQTALPA